MFDFEKYYADLLKKNPSAFDNYPSQFRYFGQKKNKERLLELLYEESARKNEKAVSSLVSIVYDDGPDLDYTKILLDLLGKKWHYADEEIILVLEKIKDPKSIGAIYKTALDIPPNDDMRALARKCVLALLAINTKESIEKVLQLAKHQDRILRNYTIERLESFNSND